MEFEGCSNNTCNTTWSHCPIVRWLSFGGPLFTFSGPFTKHFHPLTNFGTWQTSTYNNSILASSYEDYIIMSQTPGPNTRARASRGNTPAPSAVPAIGVGQSFTYGAPGKAVLRTQVATESTSLTSIMQNARARPKKAGSVVASAVDEEDEDDEQSVASKAPSRRSAARARQGSRRQTAEPEIGEEMEPVAGGTAQAGAGLRFRPAAATTSSGAASRADPGVVEPFTAAPRRLDTAEMDRSGTIVDGVAEYEPGRLQVTLGTIPRYVPQMLLDAGKDAWSFLKALVVLTLIFLAAMLAAMLAYNLSGPLQQLASSAASTFMNSKLMRPSPYSSTSSVTAGELTDLQRDWFAWKYNGTIRARYPDKDLRQFGINIVHMERLDDLEKRMNEVELRVGIHNNTLEMLDDLLPTSIAVRKVDGQWEIPELFWRALHEKMSDEAEAAPLWDGFLQGNKRRLLELSQAATQHEIGVQAEKGHIITPEMFREAIAQNFATMEEQFGEQLRKAELMTLVKMREEAQRTTTETIERTPVFRLSRMQASALAYANLIKNTQEAMENINFFSPGLGARVNPHASSATYRKPGRGLFNYLYTDPHPPIKALQRWDEIGDCWCAAPSTEKGKAQIEILMGQNVYPMDLIIDHIPRRGTLQINAAPRELELWIETESAARATQLTKHLEEDVLSWGRGGCGEAPTPKHLCIGKGTYNIHHDNWVQSFGMFAPMEANGIAANKAIVRVVSNWGADYTCLYRLRLTGERVDVTQGERTAPLAMAGAI